MINSRKILILITAMMMLATAALPIGPAAMAAANTAGKETTWSRAKTMARGEIKVEEGDTLKLNAPVTITGNVSVSGGGLILRGDKLDERSAMFIVKEGGRLTLNDIVLDGGGVWPAGKTPAELSAMSPDDVRAANTGLSSLAPVVSVNGELNMEEGAVIRNNFNMSDSLLTHAGAVVIGQVRGDSGVANMNGGSIRDNYSARAAGGVSINSEKATFNMKGGSIENNAASTNGEGASVGGVLNMGSLNIEGGKLAGNAGSKAGAVYDGSEAGFVMAGGLIDGYNTATGEGQVGDGVFAGNQAGEIILSGDAHIDADMNLGTDEAHSKHIRLKEEVGNGFIVTPPQYEDGAVIAKGWNTHRISEDDVKRMIIPTDEDGNKWYAAIDDGQAVMKQGDSPYKYDEVYLGGGPEPSDENAGISLSASVASFDKAKEMLNKGGTIYIGGGVEVEGSEEWSLPKDEFGDAVLKRLPEGQGGAASQYEGALIEVKEGAQLTLKDLTIDGGAEWDGLINTPAAQAENKGISLEGEEAGALINSSGTLVLDEGAVLQNADATQSEGGAIHVEQGSLEVKPGAEIKNNRALNGAGVFAAEGSEVSIEGGNIEGNAATDTAGAVYAEGNLDIKDAQIFANAADTAGGVFAAGRANIEGSAFENNRSTEAGGALLLGDEASITNSLFSENSSGEGGAIFLQEGAEASAENIQVEGNSAGTGAGFYVAEGSSLLLGDQTSITGNTSMVSAGGVYQQGALQVAGDVDISDNQLLVFPSDVYLANDENVVEVVGPLTGEGSIGVNAAIADEAGRQLVSAAPGQQLTQEQAGKFVSNASEAATPVLGEDGQLAVLPKQPDTTGSSDSTTPEPVATEQPSSEQPTGTEQPGDTEQPESTPEPEVTGQPEATNGQQLQALNEADEETMQEVSMLFSRMMLRSGEVEDPEDGDGEPEEPEEKFVKVSVHMPAAQEVTFGYDKIEPMDISIENKGNMPAEVLTITPVGDNASGFELGDVNLMKVDVGVTETMTTITPKTGLPVGEYKYEISVEVEGLNAPVMASMKFNVVAKQLKPADLEYQKPETTYVYKGSKFEPLLDEQIKWKVSDEGEDAEYITLVKGTDYILEYGANTNVADATKYVKIIFQGNYKGEIEHRFEITPKPIESTSIYLHKPQTNEPAQTEFYKESDHFTVDATWNEPLAGGLFKPNTVYVLTLKYTAEENYKFDNDFEVTQRANTGVVSGKSNDSKVFKFDVTFDETKNSPVSGMEVTMPNKMEYKPGVLLDFTGMKVTFSYDGDTDEEVDFINDNLEFNRRIEIKEKAFVHETPAKRNEHDNKRINLLYRFNKDHWKTLADPFRVLSNNTDVVYVKIMTGQGDKGYEMHRSNGLTFKLVLPAGMELPSQTTDFTYELAEYDSEMIKKPVSRDSSFTVWDFTVKASDGTIDDGTIVVSTLEDALNKNQLSLDEKLAALNKEFPEEELVPSDVNNKQDMTNSVKTRARDVLGKNFEFDKYASIEVISYKEPVHGTVANPAGEDGGYVLRVVLNIYSTEEAVPGSTKVTGSTEDLVFTLPATPYNAKPTATLTFTPDPVESGTEFTVKATTEDIHSPAFEWFVGASADIDDAEPVADAGSTDSLKQMAEYTGEKIYYFAKVTGGNGVEVVAGPLEIDVALSKPKIKMEEGGKFLTGTDLTIEPEISSDEGELSYQWLKDGVVIPGETSATLKMANMQLGEKGEYVLRVKKTMDKASNETDSTPYKLEVVAPDPAVIGVNVINGLSDGQEIRAKSNVTFTVDGAGMKSVAPRIGLLRWLPVSWKINPEGTFPEEGPYTGTFKIDNIGDYTLEVLFAEQVYDGAAWKKTEKTTTERVQVKVKEEDKATATPTPSNDGKATPTPNPGSNNNGNGDNTGNNGNNNGNGTNGNGNNGNGTNGDGTNGNGTNGNGTNGNGTNGNGTNGNGTNATPTPTPKPGGNGDDTAVKSNDNTAPTASPTATPGTGDTSGTGTGATATPGAGGSGGGAGGTGGGGSGSNNSDPDSSATPSPTDDELYTGELINVPRTGDDSNAAGWILIMMLAAAIAGGVVLKNRQAKNKAGKKESK